MTYQENGPILQAKTNRAFVRSTHLSIRLPMVYSLYIVALLILIYTAPALSIYPRLISSPQLAVAIPVISSLVIYVIETILLSFRSFSQMAVMVISVSFGIIATVRVVNFLRSEKLEWSKPHTISFLITILVLIPCFAKLGTSAFDSNDEIYSWNMWAVQYYLGESPDFYYTKFPYPQLFPKLIAYCYKLFGTVELQMPVKALLIIFPFVMFAAISAASKKNGFRNVCIYTVILIVGLFGIELNDYLEDGLADPMMAASLTVSVLLYLRFLKENKLSYLWLSLFCGITSAYAKQPALIWTLFGLPILLIKNLNQRNKIQILAILSISIVSSLYWVLGEGKGFYDNYAVVQVSQSNRNLIEQLIFSIHKFFIKKPLILIMLALTYASLQRSKKHRDIFFLVVLPTLAAWFLYGAYSLRLGIHVIALSMLLLMSTDLSIPFLKPRGQIREAADAFIRRKYGMVVLALLLLAAISLVVSFGYNMKKPLFGGLYLGGRHTIRKYFGEDSESVYRVLYDNPEIILWVPTNYIYGIFYGHTELIRPDYTLRKPYDKKAFLSEIKSRQPDYLFAVGERVAYGPGSAAFKEAIGAHPFLFERVYDSPNKYNYVTYRLNKAALSKYHFPSD